MQRIVPPILASFTDQDSRVRYYAIESLWNVAKSTRDTFLQAGRESGWGCRRGLILMDVLLCACPPLKLLTPLLPCTPPALPLAPQVFPEVFDALFRLCSDADTNVQAGATRFDR